MKFRSTLYQCVILALLALQVSGQEDRTDDPDLQGMLAEYSSEHMTESYRFKFATSDGQFREEVGMLMSPGTPEEELVVMGMYGYETDDGTEVMVMYVSGKKGYQAKTKFRKLAESERKKKLLASLVG